MTMKFILFLIMVISLKTNAQPFMIAHAGGRINGQNYSNSLEALNLNYDKGFRTFEIDFSWTSDGQLVCLHDWDKRFKKVFGFKTKHALNYEQFQTLVKNTNKLHPCTLETLDLWLIEHPDVKVITDVKYNNIKAIRKIINQYPHLLHRLIPQFYQAEEYAILKSLGFKQLIWILYQFEGKLSSVVEHVKNMDLLAISMRASQAKKKFAQTLIVNGESVFVYTINKQKMLEKLVNKYQVSGIYTDFL
jgi:glycerophosphoryl diester phosphodiesterase